MATGSPSPVAASTHPDSPVDDLIFIGQLCPQSERAVESKDTRAPISTDLLIASSGRFRVSLISAAFVWNHTRHLIIINYLTFRTSFIRYQNTARMLSEGSDEGAAMCQKRRSSTIAMM